MRIKTPLILVRWSISFTDSKSKVYLRHMETPRALVEAGWSLLCILRLGSLVDAHADRVQLGRVW